MSELNLSPEFAALEALQRQHPSPQNAYNLAAALVTSDRRSDVRIGAQMLRSMYANTKLFATSPDLASRALLDLASACHRLGRYTEAETYLRTLSADESSELAAQARRLRAINTDRMQRAGVVRGLLTAGGVIAATMLTIRKIRR